MHVDQLGLKKGGNVSYELVVFLIINKELCGSYHPSVLVSASPEFRAVVTLVAAVGFNPQR